VLLGHSYDVAIDMWSLGCMAAELFLGLPLFPGASEHDLLVRITETLGPPPEALLKASQHTYKFFRRPEEGGGAEGGRPGWAPRYQMRSQADFESTNGQLAPAGGQNLYGFADLDCLRQGLSSLNVRQSPDMTYF
jgi:dual specificity protein kinase YAK1